LFGESVRGGGEKEWRGWKCAAYMHMKTEWWNSVNTEKGGKGGVWEYNGGDELV
jgi:hypothetical protein